MTKSRVNGGVFDLNSIHAQLLRIEEEKHSEHFWNDKARVEQVMAESTKLSRYYEEWRTLREEVADALEITKMVLEEQDEKELPGLVHQFLELEERYRGIKIKSLLHEKDDDKDAYLSIHTGAGGTESCDWVRMLFRMYSRWVEIQGYKMEILDLQEGEGGIKSVSMLVKGDYAFGYLSTEIGVHRLVRISPFDSGKRRHTTFAAVYASPAIQDDIQITIKPEDIRVDTYRSRGAGGQHVNTTDSAVRITHLETGIVVQCQGERSQIKNKQSALKVLKSRLYAYYEAERTQHQELMAATKQDIAWGRQIRSYVFHPYSLVKDHRTNAETSNVQMVMDGKIDLFIEAFLQKRVSNVDVS